MNERVRISLLGPAQVEIGDRLDMPHGKPLALLGRLVACGEWLSRDHVASLLWPALPVDRGHANLSWTLHKLSTALPDCFEADRYSLRFARTNGVWVDLTAFDAWFAQAEPAALIRATELYRGDFLQDFCLDCCPEFELWLVQEREHWSQRTATALETLVTTYRNRGEHLEALRYARRLLAIEPWRESAHQEVMRLLVAIGRRGGALMQYRRCKQALAQELGVTPSHETERLYRAIRDT